MEFTILREELLQGLYLMQGIVERRSTIPILANVLIESAGEGISITATDQEIGVRCRCAAKVKKKGSLTAGARKLYEIVRELPDEPITVRSLENHWTEVLSGKSRFKIVGLDPKEFPALRQPDAGDTANSITVPSGLLRRMIELTAFAVSMDDARPNLCGIFFERPEAGTLRLVSTDGHRLSMVTRTVEGGSAGAGVIIPRKGVNEVSKILESGDEPVMIQISANAAHVTRGAVDLSMRLAEGDFPDYKEVVPQKSERRLVLEKEPFLSALRRVSIVSAERTHGVKLQIDSGRVELSAANSDLGEASDELQAEYDGVSFSIGFNARYLIDVLGAIGSTTQVEIGLNDEVSPGVVRYEGDSEFLYVVMPMRL